MAPLSPKCHGEEGGERQEQEDRDGGLAFLGFKSGFSCLPFGCKQRFLPARSPGCSEPPTAEPEPTREAIAVNTKALLRVVPSRPQRLPSTRFEGIMPPIPLMHPEAADTRQRSGLKRSQSCLTPHFAGSWGFCSPPLLGKHRFTNLDLSGE